MFVKHSLVEYDGGGDHDSKDTEDEGILASDVFKHIQPQTSPHTPRKQVRAPHHAYKTHSFHILSVTGVMVYLVTNYNN